MSTISVKPINICPDDVLFFREVAEAMVAIAREENLPLTSIIGLPAPTEGKDCRFDHYGDFHRHTGEIRLMLRCVTPDGAWEPHPRNIDDVWNTAAHELAHFASSPHNETFYAEYARLLGAIDHYRRNHKSKDDVLGRIIKLQRSSESEAKIGNEAAAMRFAEKVNRMIIEHMIDPREVSAALGGVENPIVERVVRGKNPNGVDDLKWLYDNKRHYHEDALARVVTEAHMCARTIYTRSNMFTLYGTKNNVDAAEAAFLTFIETGYQEVEKATIEWVAIEKQQRATLKAAGLTTPKGRIGGIPAFKLGWWRGYSERIRERYEDIKESVLEEMSGGNIEMKTTAILRLNTALEESQKFVDNMNIGYSRLTYAYSRSASKFRNVESTGRGYGRAAGGRVAIGKATSRPSQLGA